MTVTNEGFSSPFDNDFNAIPGSLASRRKNIPIEEPPFYLIRLGFLEEEIDGTCNICDEDIAGIFNLFPKIWSVQLNIIK